MPYATTIHEIGNITMERDFAVGFAVLTVMLITGLSAPASVGTLEAMHDNVADYPDQHHA